MHESWESHKTRLFIQKILHIGLMSEETITARLFIEPESFSLKIAKNDVFEDKEIFRLKEVFGEHILK